ncbi:hypothetical protein ARMSODRAFT_101312 [Armillaria solidipes]|uniref:Uncharacterized protein n=1 Tax=Armillaria solidipes TaxID=1076256 RepID=A0A2H3B4L2_9AGAR|nr:hypothetical protein ARMSODRAFT_101312 [Armillaria solidipes]
MSLIFNESLAQVWGREINYVLPPSVLNLFFLILNQNARRLKRRSDDPTDVATVEVYSPPTPLQSSLYSPSPLADSCLVDQDMRDTLHSVTDNLPFPSLADEHGCQPPLPCAQYQIRGPRTDGAEGLVGLGEGDIPYLHLEVLRARGVSYDAKGTSLNSTSARQLRIPPI